MTDFPTKLKEFMEKNKNLSKSKWPELISQIFIRLFFSFCCLLICVCTSAHLHRKIPIKTTETPYMNLKAKVPRALVYFRSALIAQDLKEISVIAQSHYLFSIEFGQVFIYSLLRRFFYNDISCRCWSVLHIGEAFLAEVEISELDSRSWHTIVTLADKMFHTFVPRSPQWWS